MDQKILSMNWWTIETSYRFYDETAAAEYRGPDARAAR